MKKLTSLVLVFAIIFTLIVPAQASSFDEDNFIDFLALSDSETNTYDFNGTSFEWRLDYNIPSQYRYVDVLFFSTNQSVTSVDVYGLFPLTVISLGNGYFRAFGNFHAYRSYFSLNFNFTDPSSLFTIISCRGSALSQQTFTLGGSWNGSTATESNNHFSGTFDGINETTIYQENAGEAAYVNYTYGYDIRFFPGITDNWKAYDEISLTFGFVGLTINSIAAYIDSTDIIKSISFLDNGTYTDLRYNINNQYFFETSNDWRYCTITLDLTKVHKTTEYYPTVRILGTYEPRSQEALFTIGHCNGIVFDGTDTDSIWYKRIYASMSSLLSSIDSNVELFRQNFFTVMASLQSNLSTWLTDLGNYFGIKIDEMNSNLGTKLSDMSLWLGGKLDSIWLKLDDILTGKSDGQTSADDFNSDIGNQDSELDEMTSIMDSVDRPDIDDVDLSAAGMIDINILSQSTLGLGVVLGNEIILRLLLMALSFSLVGFILYGKR